MGTEGQTALFLLCIVLGGILGLIYDTLRLLRRMIPHRRIWVQLEDGLYWFLAAFFVFAVLLRENHGQMCFFLLLGLFGGLGLYALVCSHIIMSIGESILRLFQRLFLLLLEVILTPFRLLYLPFRTPIAKCHKFCKKHSQNILQSCRIYAKIKKSTLRRDFHFFRHKP